MKNSKCYGNDKYWCYIDDLPNRLEVAIWKGSEDDTHEYIVARAIDKYEAKSIIDALLSYSPKEEKNFGKKELAFLEFVCSQCREPYATMASNAILWTDKEVYNRLKNDFPNIYQ